MQVSAKLLTPRAVFGCPPTPVGVLSQVSRWGGRSAWPKLAHLVSSAQQQVTKYLEETGILDRFG